MKDTVATMKYLSLKIFHTSALTLKGYDAHVGSYISVAGKVVKLIWLVKGHLSAFQHEPLLIRRADHLALVDIHHFPEVVRLAVVIEIFGKFHIKNGDDLADVENPVKAQFYNIILHNNRQTVRFYKYYS